MEVANTDSDCVGNEPVYQSGQVVGVTTSGAYGHTVGMSLAFAYVPPNLIAVGTTFDILVLGEMRKARIIAESAWDSSNARIKT
jgi:dimethylglycine dehydrogenase